MYKLKIRPLLYLCTLATVGLFAEPVQSVLFQGDYGGANRNSALGSNNPDDFQYFSETDLNGDTTADARRYIPLLFPYVPALDPENDPDLGPKFTDFGIDEDLFGVNSFFYVGGQVVNYSSAPGDFPLFGLNRYNGGAKSFQVTSGVESPSSDMGLLVSWVVEKGNFLNGSKSVADLKLPNAEDAFFISFMFRGKPILEGIRRARFIIRAGDTWYISGTGTANDLPSPERSVEGTLSINPATDMWYEYDEEDMAFFNEDANGNLIGTGVRGDSLSDITVAGVILQNSRFDGLFENHAVWLQAFDFGMKLDPDPEPVVEEPVEPWLDTGDWLGNLYVVNAPWVYSEILDSWLYVPEETSLEATNETGGWLFVPAP